MKLLVEGVGGGGLDNLLMSMLNRVKSSSFDYYKIEGEI
jgi:hypothetical protein